MNKLFVTGDKTTDFITANYDKVKDFLKCYERAQEHYPTEIQKKIKIWLNDAGYDNVDNDKECLWFSDNRYYNKSEDAGIYYCIGKFNWDCMAAEEKEDGMWMSLAVGEIKPRYLNRWLNSSKNVIKKNETLLRNKSISIVGDQDLDKEDLAVRYLNDILHMDKLTTISIDKVQELLLRSVKEVRDIFTGDKGIVKPFFKK